MKIEEFERLKQQSIGHLIIKAGRIYNEYAFNVVKYKMGVENLKPSHLQLFAHIPFEGITIVDLAESLNISKQAVSKSVKELLSAGVLMKRENHSDSRSFFVTFDTKKKSSLFKGMKELAALDQEIYECLGKNKAKTLENLLNKVISEFES